MIKDLKFIKEGFKAIEEMDLKPENKKILIYYWYFFCSLIPIWIFTIIYFFWNDILFEDYGRSEYRSKTFKLMSLSFLFYSAIGILSFISVFLWVDKRERR